MEKLLATLIRFTFRILSLIPPRLLGGLGAGIARTAFYIDRRHREVALRNLARIYPEKPRAERRHIARESFAELGRTLFELPHVFLRPEAFLRSRIETVGAEHLAEAMKQNKGAILTTAHFGNWELMGVFFSLLDCHSATIYRKIRQPLLETYVKGRRQRFGAELHARSEGLRWLPKALQENRAVFVAIDQYTEAGGIRVPFLGHLAGTTTLPATFARKRGTPLLGVALERIGRSFRFRLNIWPIAIPETDPDREHDSYRVMQAVCDSFAPLIHKRPELWLWSHRRWRSLEGVPEMAEVVHGTP